MRNEAVESARAARVVRFDYPVAPLGESRWKDWEESLSQCRPESEEREELSPAPSASVEEQKRTAFEDGFAQGLEEGRRQERATHAGGDAERTARLAAAVEAFGAAQERILQVFEPEVVRLALAIAARILRREAHTDPLLLAGAVRVALGQLGGSAEARLRVPAAEEQMWTEWVAMLPNSRTKVRVEAAEGMRLGECVVETDLGSVDLGVRAQLKEIEGSFFEAGHA